MTEQTIIAIKYTLTCRCALQKWSEVKPKIGVKKFLLFYEKFYTIKGTFAILLNEILFLILRYFRYLINMFLFWLCCTFYFYNFWKNFPDLKKNSAHYCNGRYMNIAFCPMGYLRYFHILFWFFRARLNNEKWLSNQALLYHRPKYVDVH